MAYSLATRNATRNFLKTYGEGIAKAVTDTNLFFPAIVAQKALESGWGRSGLAKEANNFGGIKYAPSLAGVIGYVTKDTTEYKKGCRCKTVDCDECKYFVKANFSKFKDVESGIRATIRVLMGDRYKDAREKAKTPQEQILMIARAGYTTTPPQKYLDSLNGIIEATQDATGLGRIISK
jgi:flagellum-specific peptidoglycan hydrolase FlgJ